VFGLDDVQPPSGYSPLQTLDAKGRTLYIDGNHFADKQLLALLSPPTEYEMAAQAAKDLQGGADTGAAAKPAGSEAPHRPAQDKGEPGPKQ